MLTGALTDPSVGPLPNAASVSSTDKGSDAPIAGECDETAISTPTTKVINVKALSWRLSGCFPKIIVEAHYLANHRIRFVDRETVLASSCALQVHRSLVNERCLKPRLVNIAGTFPDLPCRRGIVKNHDSSIIHTMKFVVKAVSEGSQFFRSRMSADRNHQPFATGSNFPLSYYPILAAISGREV